MHIAKLEDETIEMTRSAHSLCSLTNNKEKCKTLGEIHRCRFWMKVLRHAFTHYSALAGISVHLQSLHLFAQS